MTAHPLAMLVLEDLATVNRAIWEQPGREPFPGMRAALMRRYIAALRGTPPTYLTWQGPGARPPG